MIENKDRNFYIIKVITDIVLGILSASCISLFLAAFFIGVKRQGAGSSLALVSLWIGVCGVPIGGFFGIRYVNKYLKNHTKYYPHALGIASIPCALLIYFTPV